MRKKLTIDRGNTATKAMLWEGKKAVWQHTTLPLTLPQFRKALNGKGLTSASMTLK